METWKPSGFEAEEETQEAEKINLESLQTKADGKGPSAFEKSENEIRLPK